MRPKKDPDNTLTPVSVRFSKEVVDLVDQWQKDTGASNRTEALESIVKTVKVLINTL